MSDTLHVNLNLRHQVIDGFGASGAWWAQDIGGWPEETRQHIADLLFDRQRGIGLSVYRYNIGAGDGHEIRDPWRRAETFETGPGVYDWSRDRNAIWVLQTAHRAGVEHLVAFVNSPPARMTRSGLVSGPDTDRPGHKAERRAWRHEMLATSLGRPIDLQRSRSNLRPDMVEPFARYLVDVVRHLRQEEGIPIGWISPINEPQWGWCRDSQQEGCHYTPAECAAVTRALVRAVREAGLDVQVSVVESGTWLFSGVYARQLFTDPELASALDTFCLHSYQSTPLTKWLVGCHFRRRYPHLRLWMSEWVEMHRPASADIDSGLVLARTIHDDLSIGGATSWQYWIAVSKYDFCDGLIYVDPQTRSYTETKRLWALGNWSRFVRPGDVRVDVQHRGTPLQATAFYSPARDEVCLVVINSQPAPITFPISFAPVPAGVRSCTVFETSEAHNLHPVYQGQVPAGLTFSPYSVTTLLLTSETSAAKPETAD